MGYLLERNVQVLFVSASSVKDNGKKRMIVIESRPEYAVVTLTGSRKQFPLSWEMIYEAAKRHHQKICFWKLRQRSRAILPGGVEPTDSIRGTIPMHKMPLGAP